MDDYSYAWHEMTTLPPQRVHVDLTPDQLLAVIRADYGLAPHEPILSSERPPPRYRPPAVAVEWGKRN